MASYEYDGAYRYKRYRRPVKIKKYVVAAILIAVVIGGVAWFHGRVCGLLWKVSEAAVRAGASDAVNAAVYEVSGWNAADYASLVHITRDAQGNVLSIETDAQGINLLARQTSALAAVKLNAACEKGVRVPVGAFTGIEMLAGVGFKTTFRTIPVGSVTCDSKSSFRSAGINQTLHSLYFTVTACVRVVLPSGSKEVSVSVPVLVCENVIVGKIPEIYLPQRGESR